MELDRPTIARVLVAILRTSQKAGKLDLKLPVRPLALRAKVSEGSASHALKWARDHGLITLLAPGGPRAQVARGILPELDSIAAIDWIRRSLRELSVK
ncbi:MAG: hypothetical protein H0V77_09045 [Actinobacteria bacterium]|nr:hypothetical protein [Actinomycetota bacterium]